MSQAPQNPRPSSGGPRKVVLNAWAAAVLGAVVVGVGGALLLSRVMDVPDESGDRHPSEASTEAQAPAKKSGAQAPAAPKVTRIDAVPVQGNAPAATGGIVLEAAELSGPPSTGKAVAAAAQVPGDVPAGTASKSRTQNDRLARLSGTRNDVKSRRAGNLQWRRARRGMNLFEDDAVKTGRRSSAVVTFDENRRNVLNVNENTLVVIKSIMKALPNRRAVQNELVLIEGNLQGRWQRTRTGQDVVLEMQTPSAAVRIDTRKSRSGTAEAVVTVDPKTKVAGISVFDGSVEVESSATGQKVKVESGQFTAVSKGAAPMQPVPLPGAPRLEQPSQGSRIPLVREPARVSFSWREVSRGKSYRFELARDALFQDLVHTQEVRGASLSWDKAGRGRYFWRVNAVDGAGRSGRYSATAWFEAVSRGGDPDLDIDSPKNHLVTRESTVALRGRTVPGARLEVNNQRVPLGADGKFDHPVPLREGGNSLAIQVIDPDGNTATRQRFVTYKPRAESANP